MNSRDPAPRHEPRPEQRRELNGCVAAHRRLMDTIAGLTDDQARAPSRLPGWSVGHVLTHLARNADAFRGLVDGAERGEVVPMYPSADARTAGIEAGAGRRADELVEDVRSAAERLEAAWAGASERAWSGEGLAAGGPLPIAETPARRWREVEVHHADLGLGFDWSDWSTEYVRSDLVRMEMLWASRRPMGMASLPPAALAAPPAHRLAWLLGRATIDGLAPAGIY